MHMKSRSKLRSLRGACKDFPKEMLKLKTKVTDAEKLKFKVFFLPRLEMRSVFQVLPEAASKIIQTTTETTKYKGSRNHRRMKKEKDGTRENSWFLEISLEDRTKTRMREGKRKPRKQF